MTGSVADLPNLGPASAELLRSVGIRTCEDMMRADPFLIYRRLQSNGQTVSLNLLYAMIGAQTGRSWQSVQKAEKARIMGKLSEMD